eukprot:GSMAST32.ASY1.ANO1.1151.1 assembled CDS
MGICSAKVATTQTTTMHENLVANKKYGKGKYANIRRLYSGVDSFELLGEGLSGQVKIITRRSDGEQFALKVMNCASLYMASGTDALKAIRSEIALLSATDHPNVARLYETYNERNRFLYLVLELCSGGELFERLANSKSGHLTEYKAAKLVVQMLSSINYLHSKNIVHRDLKLENFVFANKSESSPLKLIDFGFAKQIKNSSDSNMKDMVGTSYYIAPEIALQKMYNYKCDIWSLGVITFMILSGSPPFPGPNDKIILSKIKRGKFSFSRKADIWNGISTDAKNFVRRLLTFDPDLRPTAAEALNDTWIMKAEQEHPPTPLPLEVFDSMKNFSNMNKLKQLIVKMFMNETKLRKAFDMLDVDHSGQITKKNLKEVLGSQFDSTEATQMLEKYGGTDGVISYEEFLLAMKM